MYLVRFDNFVLFFIAVLANIWMLINNNFYYWDDYALVSHDYEVLYNWFYQSTGYLAYYVAGLHTLFLDYLGGVLAYRLFTFILNVFSGILFYKIMHHFFVISYRRRGGDGDCRIDALIVSSLFIMFPFYTAQYALIMLPYTVSILLFFAASYMVLFLKKRALVTFVSLIMYLFSFTINSVLILYLFLMLALVLFTGKRFSIKFSYLKIKEYWLFFILPFIFVALKFMYFEPSGIYEGYNDVSGSKLEIVSNAFYQAYDLFLQGLYQIFIRPGVWIAVVFFLVSLAIFGSRWVSNKESAGPSRGYYGVVLIISVVLCALSILPYALVGKYPSPFSWDDRHYLTFSIVFPIFVLSFIRFLLGKFYYLALCLFLGVFFYERLYQGYLLYKDGMYQDSVVHELSKSEIFRSNSSFVIGYVPDNFFANRRWVNVYEWNGMFEKAGYLSDKAMAVAAFELEGNDHWKTNSQYNAFNWSYQPPVDVCMTMQPITFNDVLERILGAERSFVSVQTCAEFYGR